MSEFCAQCKSQDGLKRCSRCRNVSYCSKECQLANWKSHKPHCEPISGSDSKNPPGRRQSPQSQGKDITLPANKIPKTPRASSAQSSNTDTTVWGVKLLPSQHGTKHVPGPRHELFVSWHFESTHPIFWRGELCPFTVLYGIPIILYSPVLRGGTSFDPNDRLNENQPAVYLRIEPHDGFAPMYWQTTGVGTCYAVRRDKQPLSKKLVETMYEFHSSLLNSDYFEGVLYGNGKLPYPITPTVFQAFSDKYWEKERKNRRTLSDGDGR